MQIILHSDDMALLIHWEKSINEKCYIVDDLESLKCIKNSIVILNFSSCGTRCREIIFELQKFNNKVLILHRTPNINSAKEILGYGARGYGNALLGGHFLVNAVETIKENMVWLHPEFTSLLIQDIPSTKDDKENLLSSLTVREKEVALLLKDGDTYKLIAQKLDITPRTIKAHAGHIYAKLNIKDRVGLALLLK